MVATNLDRRSFLQLSGLGAAGSLLGSCSTAPGTGTGDGGGAEGGAGTLTWWDFRNPIVDLAKEMHARWAKTEDGMPVEVSYYQTSKIGQALQLAKQSKQLPDVFTPAGLDLSVPALIEDGWYQPLRWDDEFVRKTFPSDAIFDGIHVFDGKMYSFPIFTPRQYWASTWFNADMLSSAGLDPGQPPTTYDEFRSACRKVMDEGGDGVYGWIFNLGMAGRVREQVDFLAQAAGFPGAGGVRFDTGEFDYAHDAYVQVIEFLLSLQQDDLLFPGSSGMNDKVARTRWAAGAAAFYFDGPWCAGVVSQDLAPFTETMGVGPMLVPEAGMPVTAYRGPVGGAYWLAGSCRHPDRASELLKLFTTTDYYRGMVRNMVQPPIDTGVIDSVDVLPAYERCLRSYEGAAFLAPSSMVKNPEYSKVQAETKPVTPHIGEVVQGLFSGDLTDIRRSLKDLDARHEKARSTALSAARQAGAKVDESVWTFPNWQPRQDYTKQMYG